MEHLGGLFKSQMFTLSKVSSKLSESNIDFH